MRITRIISKLLAVTADWVKISSSGNRAGLSSKIVGGNWS